jgi:hypothetical protein
MFVTGRKRKYRRLYNPTERGTYLQRYFSDKCPETRMKTTRIMRHSRGTGRSRNKGVDVACAHKSKRDEHTSNEGRWCSFTIGEHDADARVLHDVEADRRLRYQTAECAAAAWHGIHTV